VNKKIKIFIGKENFSFKNLMTISGFIEVAYNNQKNTHTVTDLVLISFTPEYQYDKSKTMQLCVSDLINLAYHLRELLVKKEEKSDYERLSGGNANLKKMFLGFKDSHYYINFSQNTNISIGIKKSFLPGVIKQIENLAAEITNKLYLTQRRYFKIDSQRNKEGN
jgi:hypothetical protein